MSALITALLAGLGAAITGFIGYRIGKGDGFMNGWESARTVYDEPEQCLVCVAFVKVKDRWIDNGKVVKDLHRACAETFVGKEGT